MQLIKEEKMTDAQFMQRCLDIAQLGIGTTSPNPSVGAVIVSGNRIIGEGFTSPYGGAHAEVNALRSVRPEDKHLCSQSTIYVTLEPCHHFGKTPPCVDAIIAAKIQRVVVSIVDPYHKVAGKSIEKLRAHGVVVETGLLEAKAKRLIAPFLTNITLGRSHVILKFAQSIEGNMGKKNSSVWLSNPITKRHAHGLRHIADAILIGTNTAIVDNPMLDTRFYRGNSPTRVVLDRQGRLRGDLKVFKGTQKTIIVSEKEGAVQADNVSYLVLDFSSNFWQTLLSALLKLKLGILLIEGGSQIMHDIVAQGIWDEAYIYQTPTQLPDGLAAPKMSGELLNQFPLGDNTVQHLANNRL